MKTRRIELYGRLRDLGLGPSVSVPLPANADARAAVAALKARLGARAAALSGCALATGDAVLGPRDRVPAGRLALLPPVCGG
jgi:hypothetical protein